MLNAEEILKRAEKKSKKFSHFQTKGLPSSGKDRPWQNNEVTPEKVTSITIKEDNIMNDNLKVPENQPNINREKTGRKLVDNREKSGRNPETMLRQSRDKPSTNLVQTEYKPSTNLVQTEYKPSAQPSTTLETEYKPSTTFSNLAGLQRRLTKFVYDECKVARAKTTKQLSIEYIIKALNAPYFSIKATIQRLIKKGVIVRGGLKQGRGGWVTYGVSDLVFNEILRDEETEYKPSTNLVQCSKIEQKPSTQPSTSLAVDPVSSSYIINTTTTNCSLDPQKSNLPEIWQKVDIDILQNIGFSESHLKQLVEKNIPECVEESLKHFAFGLLHNPKTKQYSDPLNVLMGVLRKGQAWVESNYKSQLEITTEEFLQRKKSEAERIGKLKDAVFSAEFQEWENTLSDEDKKTITLSGDKNVPEKVNLRLHFKTKVWPEKKKDHELTKHDPE